MTSFTVYLGVALMNFVGSIIQGVAGIGDAIFLQVMWAIAAEMNSDFISTPLGKESVVAVTLVMYIRLLFMSPLIVYLGLSDSIFSKQMVMMMAIPSTILSVVGVLLLPYADPKFLKQLLAYSSFFFAFVYGCILVKNQLLKGKRIAKLKEKNVHLTAENEAIKNEAQMAQDPNMINLHASFVLSRGVTPHTNAESAVGTESKNPQNAANISQANLNSSQVVSNASIILQHVAQESARLQDSFANNGSFVRNNMSFISGRFSNQQNMNGSVTTIDPETGLREGTTEAFVSTTTGNVFSADEAKIPHSTEDNVPPLSPGKLSPLSTLTYTRVRINRNLDENGKIKMTTKIGAAVAASVAGIMTSLTGVNAPPQIIFILLFDAPNYIVRVNFSAQSIPSNVLRFILGIFNHTFHMDQIPLFVDVVVFGFAGVVVGNHIGRLLGPNAFNLFVLCLLLLSALSMVTKNLPFLITCVIITAVATIGFGYYENKNNKEKVDTQRLQELEIEQRVYDVCEELIRNNNSFVSAGVLSRGNNPMQDYHPPTLSQASASGLESSGLPRKKAASFHNLDNDDISMETVDLDPTPPLAKDDQVPEAASLSQSAGEAVSGGAAERSIGSLGVPKTSSSNMVVHQDVLGSSQSTLDSPPEDVTHTVTQRREEDEEPPTEPVGQASAHRRRADYDPLYDDDEDDDNDLR